MALPLEGVRIVEMGQLIAIPAAIKLLADMGAKVVHVESCARLELYRATSFYEKDPSGEYWNRAANFYEQNRNKLGVTLDLTRPQSLDILKELIGISDVFAENFTPRVMRNFGLEYEDLRRIKPDIIMASSTGYGHIGPWSDYGAIGYATEAASGLAHATGYRTGPPALPEIPYADYTAAEHTAFAIMAALIYRAHTGEGQFIDLSHAETVSSTVPEALMDYTVNGRDGERMGNQDPTMAPHGCYRCQGDDEWIAIAVANDAQWQSLCKVLGTPAWAQEDRFADSLSRWRRRDELDALVNGVTCRWDPRELMIALQGKGVPAGAVLTNEQLLFDPHLTARDFFERVVHHPTTGMPPLPYAGGPWRMSATPGVDRRPAPLMGEHNRFVLSEMLGTPVRDLESLEREGAIGYGPLGHHTPTVVPLEEQKRQGRILDYDRRFRERTRDEYGG